MLLPNVGQIRKLKIECHQKVWWHFLSTQSGMCRNPQRNNDTTKKSQSTFFSQTNQTFQLGLHKANKVNRNATVGTAVLNIFFVCVRKITHIIARCELKCKHIKSDVKQKVKYGYTVLTIAMEKVWSQRWIEVLPENDFDFEIEAFADIELYIWPSQQMNRNWVLHCVEVWLPTRMRSHCASHSMRTANESRFINHLCRVSTGIFIVGMCVFGCLSKLNSQWNYIFKSIIEYAFRTFELPHSN